MSDWDPGSYGRVNTLQEYVAEQALQGLRVTGDERILDVGCGDGRVSELVVARLTSGSLLGVDPSAAMVAAAGERFRNRSGVDFAVATAATLPYRDEFDLVTSFNALHWETRWVEALARIRAAVRTPGRVFAVFVCDGDRPSLEDVAMDTTRTPRWRAVFGDFAAPFVHVDPDAYADTAVAAGFAVEAVDVVDLSWEFGDRAAFAAWAGAGMPAWTSRLPGAEAAEFVDDVLTAYGQQVGSDTVFRFLQSRWDLGC